MFWLVLVAVILTVIPEEGSAFIDNDFTKPVKRMFKNGRESLGKVTPNLQILLDRIENPKLRGRKALELTKLTENDALRLLTELTHLPTDVQDKLVGLKDMVIFTAEELKMLPTDIFQSLTVRPVFYKDQHYDFIFEILQRIQEEFDA